jgi:predicted esterase YcpF (UPF0227 family)
MKKEVQYYYVHGLHSSKNAKKFKDIQLKYPNSICLDWAVGDNLDYKINEWVDLVKKSKVENVLIGSSTGCNLICQMNPLLQKANNYPKTILLNPLLSLDQLINIEILPLEVLKYVREIDSFSDCLIIISDNDEVLNHGKISAQIIKSNQIIVSKNDSHKLLKFKDYFEEINRYSNS